MPQVPAKRRTTPSATSCGSRVRPLRLHHLRSQVADVGRHGRGRRLAARGAVAGRTRAAFPWHKTDRAAEAATSLFPRIPLGHDAPSAARRGCDAGSLACGCGPVEVGPALCRFPQERVTSAFSFGRKMLSVNDLAGESLRIGPRSSRLGLSIAECISRKGSSRVNFFSKRWRWPQLPVAAPVDLRRTGLNRFLVSDGPLEDAEAG